MIKRTSEKQDNGENQLKVLKGKLSELEKSNSAILSKLNERDRCANSVIKPTTDFIRTLAILKDQSRNSKRDLKTLNDTLSILNDRVNELSTTVNSRTQRKDQNVENNRRTQKKNVSSTTNDRSEKQGIHLAESRCVSYTCASEVNDSESKDSNLMRKIDTKDQHNEQIPKTQILTNISRKTSIPPKTEGKPTLKTNTYGLRSRAVSSDIDNRVRLMKDEGIVKGQPMSRPAPTASSDANEEEKTVKENLPTRDNLKLISDEEQTTSKTKQATYHPLVIKNEYKNLAGLNKDPNAAPDIRDLSSWRTLAETERQRGLSSNSLPVGKGPDTCLLLDISGSMEGEVFNEMMAAVRTFIDGIAGVAAVLGIEENIGIATFGAQTRVVQHMTNDYDRVIKTLDLLTPSGPSPMAAGLYMALACCLGHDGNTSMKNIRIRSRIILFSDGKGTPDTRASGEDDFIPESSVLTHMWINETAADLEKRKFRVYSVSLVNTIPDLMIEVCKKTHGKMYKSSEIHKLVRMTQNMTQAVEMIERGVNFEEDDISWRNKLGLSDNPLLNHLGFSEDWEEITHLGKFLSDHEPTSNIHTEYKDSNLPPLGARVRRGPDWRWNDQDQGGPGTVIGHDEHTSVWVLWDCGHRNSYRCHPLLGYDVLLVDEPRVLKGSLIAVGCLVERGDNWKYENQDGGIGSVGVVIYVYGNGIVIVRWPNMKKGRYKFGCDGLFEIKLCDPLKVYGSVGKLTTNVQAIEGSLGGAEAMSIKETFSPSTSDSKPANSRKEEEYQVHGTKEQMKEKDQIPFSDCGFDIIWAYKKNGRWVDFPEDINKKMEKAYGRNMHGSMILEVDGYVWRASFSNMKMECQKTHNVTEILRNEIID
ncbi:uncharacterized protein LOC133182550 [Saccostrea echinata]|uniref:uncharacterized protein LOC133182550 n=1 Tax=Saccostrea echinata TaxID=191078 RepID=UPI002A809B95|nr:uncharacterized protein LOC133182550 [Saccostrea echinata]